MHQRFYPFALLIFIALIAGSAIHSASQPHQSAFKNWTQKSSAHFLKQVEAFQQTAKAFRNNKVELDSLQNQFSRTRLSYKKVEFLLAYYFPEYDESHLNGAPLYRIERETNQPQVVTPVGMQVLDEMVFSENANEESAEIANLALELRNSTSTVLSGLEQENFATHQVVEAIRLEIVRLFAMGLTGFDTPGSLNALPEAAAVLSALQNATQLLFAQHEEALQMQQEFTEARKYILNHPDFNTFDRLTFLRTYINPIFKHLHAIAQNMTVDPRLPSAVNANSKGIFEPDFLNPYFYTQLKTSEDSLSLKTLGRKLFFDKTLSGNQEMSCATCHDPQMGFADGMAKSPSSVVGKTVERNSPTLLNAVYADRYFYDMRAFTLEQQAEHVIFNQAEFNTAYSEILEKINADKSYATLFEAAFGKVDISEDLFSKALASFVLSLQSFNSPFDKYARGETDEIAADVAAGFNLFMGKAACGTCHFAPTFSGLMPPRFTKNESEILGVLKSPNGWQKELDSDMGRYANEIYSEKAWIYERSFKTSTVRNVALTAPYFHNGAYQTLEEVMVFYNRGGGSGFGLEVKNQTLASDPLQLSAKEQQQIIAFLKSLTDVSCVNIK